MFVTADDGVKLFVERKGRGMPNLYIHGYNCLSPHV